MAGWNLLRSTNQDLPSILVRCDLSNSGYEISLTDLSRIWSESVSKQALIERAVQSGSSVDPSQDNDQFNIFLDKIRSAIHGEDGTSLSMASSGTDNEALQIELSAPLPRPLAPFRWTIQLQRQEERHIESDLVMPLILQANSLKRQIQQLISDLHDKDRVVSKICDRLETSGNDLTTVFPGVSNIKTSRKKGQREQLAKYVKGLEDFDEMAWTKQAKNGQNDTELSADVIDDVFRDLTSVPNRNKHSDKWWKNLNQGSKAILQASPGIRSFKADNSALRQTNNEEVVQTGGESLKEDEFQRQSTPPDLRVSSAEKRQQAKIEPSIPTTVEDQVEVTAAKQISDESTDDEEDDLDAPAVKHLPSNTFRIMPKTREITKSPKALGTIGGRSLQLGEIEPSIETINAEPAALSTRSKLGAIGGKAKVTPELSVIDEHEVTREHTPTPKSTKLGVIGGKASSKSISPTPSSRSKKLSPKQEASPLRSKGAMKAETPALEEAAPEELADQKRDQLKRELEERAKAPVKKKRKF